MHPPPFYIKLNNFLLSAFQLNVVKENRFIKFQPTDSESFFSFEVHNNRKQFFFTLLIFFFFKILTHV